MTTPNVATLRQHIIQQWRNSPRLNALLDGLLKLAQEELIDPTEDLQDMRSVELARGAWLDYIGERLDLHRAAVKLSQRNDFVNYFGFQGSPNLGFDRAPFKYPPLHAEGTPPTFYSLDDKNYREALRAKATLITQQINLETLRALLLNAGVRAFLIESNDSQNAVTIFAQTARDKNKLVEIQVYHFDTPHPAGVTLNRRRLTRADPPAWTLDNLDLNQDQNANLAQPTIWRSGPRSALKDTGPPLNRRDDWILSIHPSARAATAIPPVYIDGGGEAYITLLGFENAAPFTVKLWLATASDASNFGNNAGPSFTAETLSGKLSLRLTNIDSGEFRETLIGNRQDSTEPYDWIDQALCEWVSGIPSGNQVEASLILNYAWRNAPAAPTTANEKTYLIKSSDPGQRLASAALPANLVQGSGAAYITELSAARNQIVLRLGATAAATEDGPEFNENALRGHLLHLINNVNGGRQSFQITASAPPYAFENASVANWIANQTDPIEIQIINRSFEHLFALSAQEDGGDLTDPMDAWNFQNRGFVNESWDSGPRNVKNISENSPRMSSSTDEKSLSETLVIPHAYLNGRDADGNVEISFIFYSFPSRTVTYAPARFPDGRVVYFEPFVVPGRAGYLLRFRLTNSTAYRMELTPEKMQLRITRLDTNAYITTGALDVARATHKRYISGNPAVEFSDSGAIMTWISGLPSGTRIRWDLYDITNYQSTQRDFVYSPDPTLRAAAQLPIGIVNNQAVAYMTMLRVNQAGFTLRLDGSSDLADLTAPPSAEFSRAALASLQLKITRLDTNEFREIAVDNFAQGNAYQWDEPEARAWLGSIPTNTSCKAELQTRSPIVAPWSQQLLAPTASQPYLWRALRFITQPWRPKRLIGERNAPLAQRNGVWLSIQNARLRTATIAAAPSYLNAAAPYPHWLNSAPPFAALPAAVFTGNAGGQLKWLVLDLSSHRLLLGLATATAPDSVFSDLTLETEIRAELFIMLNCQRADRASLILRANAAATDRVEFILSDYEIEYLRDCLNHPRPTLNIALLDGRIVEDIT